MAQRQGLYKELARLTQSPFSYYTRPCEIGATWLGTEKLHGYNLIYWKTFISQNYEFFSIQLPSQYLIQFQTPHFPTFD